MVKSSANTDLRIVSVKIPVVYLDMIDDLIRNGKYVSRSEFIRTAIRKLLEKELMSEKKKAKNSKMVREL